MSAQRRPPVEPAVPVVVVAGRPNVGKSCLVNRIVGRRATVVEERAGVTRDRKALDAEWAGVPFQIVDTGGWLPGGDALDEKVSAQAERAVADADLVLFVVDVTVGTTTDDLAALRALRRAGRPLLLVANKVDDAAREAAAWELLSLGAGDPWLVSAIHGRGAGDLLDEVVRRLATSRADKDEHGDEEAHATGDAHDSASPDGARAPAPDAGTAAPAADLDEEGTFDDGFGDGFGDPGEDVLASVAIVGRPNAGKSTLFNRLIGEERSIVHDMPGTTRDAIDTLVRTEEGPLRFVDTAGMRRRARTDRGVETYATLRALEAIDRADVVLLVIDATVGATHQDQRLAERVGAAGCAAVVVVNKWDLIATEDREDVLAGVGDRLAFLGTAPVLRVSASTGRGVHRILPALGTAVTAYHQRVPTGALNRAMRDIQAAHRAPRARVRYAVQGAIDPPTFTLFATGRLPQTYLRYIERELRERFELGPVPMKLRVRIGGR